MLSSWWWRESLCFRVTGSSDRVAQECMLSTCRSFFCCALLPRDISLSILELVRALNLQVAVCSLHLTLCPSSCRWMAESSPGGTSLVDLIYRRPEQNPRQLHACTIPTFHVDGLSSPSVCAGSWKLGRLEGSTSRLGEDNDWLALVVDGIAGFWTRSKLRVRVWGS